MMHCPLCRTAAHARTSRYLSENTKERYHQCQNINCSCTFVTLESIQRQIVSPGKIDIAPPHPTRSNQGSLWI
ncbi:DNA-binding transcriptional regulator [Serratia sp. TSA_7]|uniref:DNA-binding transcriptional regulator n=1 Tax=Serratia TaxID=613 RepID=UPI0008FB7428|nr:MULTISPECIES: DNA-binding transcriptional regulator [Serratia]MDW5510251.1 DNA-binding transcriptional regulator [Serratia proteamaculans]OKP25333.1 transcriptional regulator [Serratia liquefaciens]HCT7985365.1 DNA-binding transcriptional regulator [Serratia liquefaciens]HEJ7890027.1 DNA-binding transcriptional regulator [Serratia liquefaciens]HEJ8088330.1 DNA-binding transcriptional regulator [Serratia liquefaciens]